jgi:two-component system chemotaxis response regulator CheY
LGTKIIVLSTKYNSLGMIKYQRDMLMKPVCLERRDFMIRILIVDDSVFSQNITANILRKYVDQSDIYFAADGWEGFKKFKELKPDYIFVDLLMPGLDGQSLIKLIRECDSSANIVVVTADVQNHVREEIEKLHIMTFINKPFTDEKARIICNIMKEKDNAKQ